MILPMKHIILFNNHNEQFLLIILNDTSYMYVHIFICTYFLQSHSLYAFTYKLFLSSLLMEDIIVSVYYSHEPRNVCQIFISHINTYHKT